MRRAQKILLVGGVALIVAVNAFVLAGVAWNRSGVPGSALTLTQRELSLPYAFGLDGERGGVEVALLWRAPMRDDNADAAYDMREWRDVHTQLHTLCAEHEWPENEQPAAFDALHRALLTGLLGNLGLRIEDARAGEPPYLGARGIKFWPHPGSALAKKGGKWIMTSANTDPAYFDDTRQFRPLPAMRR